MTTLYTLVTRHATSSRERLVCEVRSIGGRYERYWQSTHLFEDDVGLEVVAFSDGVNNFGYRSSGARGAVLALL